MKAKLILNKVLSELKKRFGNNLISVVLFGSHAKGLAKEHSDIDLIIICKKLAKDWRERDKLVISLEKLGFEFGIPIHIELLTAKEFEFSTKGGAPLLLEVYLTNKILYDNGFFKEQMKLLKKNMIIWKAKKTDNNTWEVPELAIKV